MKNRTNLILLALFLLTAVIYVLICLIWLDVIPLPLDELYGSSALVRFHAVPCFLLQLLLCRTAKRVVVRLIPVFLLAGLVAWFFVSLATSHDWEWALLLLLCIAPAVGLALAWVVYGVGAWWKKSEGAQEG